MSDESANAIHDSFISENETDRNFEAANVVDGLYYIGRAIGDVAEALRALGNGNASTQMGAIEALSVKIEEAASVIADGMQR